MWKVFVFVLFALTTWAQEAHPILAIGSPAPNFELPGVDGAVHKLADYSSSQVLVVVFTCNHCPIAQMYERRIAQLAADYKNRSVAVVAIPRPSPSTSWIPRT
jgi:peroxiredoxin